MIDTSKWKEFKLADIGFQNYHGVRQKKVDRTEGDTPLLTAGKENQGVASYIGNPSSVYADSITVDMFGNSFFHKGEYAGDDNIYFFVNDEISDKAKRFIAAVLNADNTKKYAFKDQFRQPQADSLVVYLPVASDNQPDWLYIEDYMAKIELAAENNLQSLLQTKETRKSIKTTEWKEYRAADLFEINKGKRLTSADRTVEGNTPYIGALNHDNGLFQYIIQDPIFHGNSITVNYNATIGQAYYQEDDYWATDDVNVWYFRPENKHVFTRNIALFICTIIIELGKSYAYTDKWKLEDMQNAKLRLPSTPCGSPDWDYMDAYMETVLTMTSKKLDILTSSSNKQENADNTTSIR